MNSSLPHCEGYVLHKTFKFVNVMPTFKVHLKINSHCIGRFELNIPNKMYGLNLDVILVATNEYQKQITIPPFELLFFIDNVTNSIIMQYLHKNNC